MSGGLTNGEHYSHSEIVENGKGIPHGVNYVFLLSAPKNWLFDNESGVSQGVHAMMYPKNHTFKTAKVVIYAGAILKINNSFVDSINNKLDELMKTCDASDFNKTGIYKTKCKRDAVTLEFYNHKFNNHEMFAFIDTPKMVCTIIMASKNKTVFENSKKSFIDVIGSFEFITSDEVKFMKEYEKFLKEQRPSSK